MSAHRTTTIRPMVNRFMANVTLVYRFYTMLSGGDGVAEPELATT